MLLAIYTWSVILLAPGWGQRQGIATVGWEVWLPQAPGSEGQQINVSDKRTWFYVLKKNFKLLRNTKGYLIRNCDHLKVRNFCQGWPMSLSSPGIKNPSYVTGHRKVRWSGMGRKQETKLMLTVHGPPKAWTTCIRLPDLHSMSCLCVEQLG